MGSPTLKNERIRRDLARNVRAFLAHNDMSESQLALKAKISQKQVNNITRARTGCGIDALAEIAAAFNCEAWTLIQPNIAAHAPSCRRLERVVARYLNASPLDQELIEHVSAKAGPALK